MKLYRSFLELAGHPHKKLVMALGNFDGVHIGHQALIKATLEMAQKLDGIPGILTFHPHPLKVLFPEQAPPMLVTVEEKIKIISNIGAEVILLAPFTKEFSALPPSEFVREILFEILQVSGIVVGYNYTFGRGGVGNPELLKELGVKYGFQVEVVAPVEVNGEIVSSTLVREYLLEGQIEKATSLLGYSPFLKGKVIDGEKRGRLLGFPTANVAILPELLIPANGVYAVKVKVGQNNYQGVANIGVKPTFHLHSQTRSVEVNIFDFNQDIYGQEIEVIFVARLRGEKAFNGVDELTKQIQADAGQARELLTSVDATTKNSHILEVR